jgi:hypothetical protein
METPFGLVAQCLVVQKLSKSLTETILIRTKIVTMCNKKVFSSVFISVVASGILALGMAAPAHAVVAAPNPFTPVGQSWVSVPTADRVYLQPGTATEFDDYSFGEIPAGVTCDSGAIVGPALVEDGLSTCVDVATAPYTPTKINFGFNINFYGQTVSGGWPNSNGSFTFDSPTSNYDDSISYVTTNNQTSGLYLGAIDLQYDATLSNLWIARTTVDGHAAFVVSWEKFVSCCDKGDATGLQSEQAVVMDLGSGDFNAYLNTDQFTVSDQGYSEFTYLADLHGATGTNVLTLDTIAGFPGNTVCQSLNSSKYTKLGTADLSEFDYKTIYGQLASAADKTISLFSDAACTTPLIVVAKDVGDYALLTFTPAARTMSVPFGWGSYDSTTGVIGIVELFPNEDLAPRLDGGASPLIRYMLNTDVPGRVLIGMRNGGVASSTDLVAAPAPAPASVLAITGFDAAPLLLSGLAIALAGIATVAIIRRRKLA